MRTSLSVPPAGYDEVVAFYGDPMKYMRDDGTVSPLWEARTTLVMFPKPLPLGWRLDKQASGARVHSFIANETAHVFALLEKEDLWRHLTTYDGGYAWRQQRGATSKLSLHAFGAALDFNAATNRQGQQGDMNTGVVQCFEACGWTWGGRFAGSRVDMMHFQFAKGA